MADDHPVCSGSFVVLAIAYVQERTLTGMARDQIGQSLQASVDSARAEAKRWELRHISQISDIAQHPTLLRATRGVLQETDRDSLLTSSALAQARSHLTEQLANYGYLGFFIIAPDGRSVASMRDANVGTPNLIAENAPSYFERALAGEALVTEPIRTDVPVVGADGVVSTAAPTMFAMAPIRDLEGQILGVFTLRINPLAEFSSIFARQRSGSTGETYAVNRDGIMISESRFRDTLRLIGLIKQGQTSMLGIPVNDPGVNAFDGSRDVDMAASPPTALTAKLLTLEDGQNLSGYRNYLGREVLGAWAWDEYLGFGVASEIGIKEAYAGLDTSLMTIRLFAACIILLLITLAVLQHRYRMKRYAQEKEILNALDQAEHANQSKMVFLSSMSHELRTPLNAVIGFSDLLLQEKSVRANPEHVEQLGHIHQSGEHLLKLVDEVLEFAKLDLGALSFRFEKVPVGVVIAESLSMMEQAAKKHGVALRCGNDDLRSLPHIWTDPTRLRQVLLNLLSNAIKYNHAGGFVTLRASIEATSLKINVEDSGRGIAPEDLPKLWEPFTRLGVETSSIEGSGIGLAFSRRIVEELGGEIDVRSAEGRGSQFWIKVPLHIPKNVEQTSTPARPKQVLEDDAPDLKDVSVLCIEDLELNQEIVKRMLARMGITQLSFAFDGKTALEKLRDNRYNLILLDINLPDMDGFEFNRRRTAMGLAKTTPVIALTASTSFETRQMAKEYGIDGFVSKPIKYDLLAKTVTEYARRPQPPGMQP